MPDNVTVSKPPTILDLFNQWSDQDKKEALRAMTPTRKAELASALIAAGWTPSALIAAGWTPSALRAAGWTPSALRAAGWTPSALIAAGWTPSALIAAGWTPSDLRAAGWTPSDLENIETSAKDDVQSKSRLMGAEESRFVVRQLKLGLLEGQSYGTVDSCGCFLGSAAKKAGMSVEKFCTVKNLKKDSSSPAEQWFMDIRVGDTPENHYAAKKAVEWIEETWAVA